jgi:hypothetical protein
MKLIDYDKYAKRWTPRSVIIFLLVEGLVTGFLLGVALTRRKQRKLMPTSDTVRDSAILPPSTMSRMSANPTCRELTRSD